MIPLHDYMRLVLGLKARMKVMGKALEDDCKKGSHLWKLNQHNLEDIELLVGDLKKEGHLK